MDKFLALSEEKQNVIINAALQCFGKYGYDKTSINDIAVAAHISKASVFQYFGSKKQLYTYLLEYCMNTIMPSFDKAVLDAEADMLNRILLSSKMKMELLKEHPFITQFVASVWEEASPEVNDRIVLLKAESGKFRSDLVLRKEDSLRFKNPEDAEAVYNMLLLMAEGYTARYRNAPEFDFEIVMSDFEKNIAILRKNFYKEEYL
ncbi:MAG: TetR/AcrR family transcriptional regulator [Lachnospiraceae bacterium]|nr:TetR/AcrR family transcriptional regulator [Lachnospiraceae bacterium]